MSGFLIPFERVESQEGDRGRDLLSGAALATSFLLPLFTRTDAAKVFRDMLKKVISPRVSRQTFEKFVREIPTTHRNLAEAASLGMGTSPDFSKLRYEGFLADHGVLGTTATGAYFPTKRRPIIAIGSDATPFTVGHEIAHFASTPTRHMPSWVDPWVRPVYVELSDPAMRQQLLTDLYATLGALNRSVSGSMANYLVDPREVLANAIAARMVPYREEDLVKRVAGSLLPRHHWRVADTLAEYITTGKRP